VGCWECPRVSKFTNDFLITSRRRLPLLLRFDNQSAVVSRFNVNVTQCHVKSKPVSVVRVCPYSCNHQSRFVFVLAAFLVLDVYFDSLCLLDLATVAVQPCSLMASVGLLYVLRN